MVDRVSGELDGMLDGVKACDEGSWSVCWEGELRGWVKRAY